MTNTTRNTIAKQCWMYNWYSYIGTVVAIGIAGYGKAGNTIKGSIQEPQAYLMYENQGSDATQTKLTQAYRGNQKSGFQSRDMNKVHEPTKIV